MQLAQYPQSTSVNTVTVYFGCGGANTIICEGVKSFIMARRATVREASVRSRLVATSIRVPVSRYLPSLVM